MEINTIRRYFRPTQILFLLLFFILIIARMKADDSWRPALGVLLVGNVLLYLATLLSFYLYRRGLTNKNVQVFLRMMYSSMLIKMGICLGGALVYFYLAGKETSKAGILGCFALYMLYTFLEVKALTSLSKLQKNA